MINGVTAEQFGKVTRAIHERLESNEDSLRVVCRKVDSIEDSRVGVDDLKREIKALEDKMEGIESAVTAAVTKALFEGGPINCNTGESVINKVEELGDKVESVETKCSKMEKLHEVLLKKQGNKPSTLAIVIGILGPFIAAASLAFAVVSSNKADSDKAQRSLVALHKQKMGEMRLTAKHMEEKAEAEKKSAIAAAVAKAQTSMRMERLEDILSRIYSYNGNRARYLKALRSAKKDRNDRRIP